MLFNKTKINYQTYFLTCTSFQTSSNDLLTQVCKSQESNHCSIANSLLLTRAPLQSVEHWEVLRKQAHKTTTCFQNSTRENSDFISRRLLLSLLLYNTPSCGLSEHGMPSSDPKAQLEQHECVCCDISYINSRGSGQQQAGT